MKLALPFGKLMSAMKHEPFEDVFPILINQTNVCLDFPTSLCLFAGV